MKGNKNLRGILNGAGVLDALLYVTGVHQSGLLLGIGLVALFLGVTDFGRQCPLLLSVRNLVQALRTKRRIEVGILENAGAATGKKQQPDSLRQE